MQVRLSNHIKSAMLEQVRRSPQREVCGLLGGRHTTAEHYYPVVNIADDPASEYLMDPKQQIGAMRRMRERGEALMGIFHSHPDSPAQPSNTDLSKAAYPDTIYLIAGFGEKEDRLELNAFYYDGKSFTPVEMDVTDSSTRV